MKKTIVRSITTALLSLILILSMISCNLLTGKQETPETNGSEAIHDLPIEAKGLWETAIHLENAELGEGAKTVTVEVEADGQSVALTLHTDKTTLGDALTDLGLIEGEMGAYGLYVKKVNGITADYDIDQSYWALYINGDYAMSGVDTTEITDGYAYRLTRAK